MMPRSLSLALLTALLAAGTGCSGGTDLDLEYGSPAEAAAAMSEVERVLEPASGILVRSLPRYRTAVRGSALRVSFERELRPGQRDSLRWIFDQALGGSEAPFPSVEVLITETDPEVLGFLGYEADTTIQVPFADGPSELGTFYSSQAVSQATSSTSWTCGVRVALAGPTPALRYTYDMTEMGELSEAGTLLQSTLERMGGIPVRHRLVTAPDTSLADRVRFDGAALFIQYASAFSTDPTVSLGFGSTEPDGLASDCADGIRADGATFAALMLPASRQTLRSVRFGDEE